MSKPNTEVPSPETPELEENPQTSPLEAFLKAKAAKQHPKNKGFQRFQHSKAGHAKLKERVRRRP